METPSDYIKSFFQNLRDRFANPLFFSFIISWIFWNWEIVVALLWYDRQQLKLSGHHTIWRFIEAHSNNEDSIWCPLYFALGYTFLAPTFKNVIDGVHTWTTMWGEKLNLWIAEGGSVPTSKYLKFREEHLKSMNELTALINGESDFKNQLAKANEDLAKAKNEIADKNLEIANQKNILSELKNSISTGTDPKILDGRWTVETVLYENGERISHKIVITSGLVFLANDETEERFTTPHALIKHLLYNKEANTVKFLFARPRPNSEGSDRGRFALIDTRQDDSFDYIMYYYDLEITPNKSRMWGHEYGEKSFNGVQFRNRKFPQTETESS